MGCTDWKPRPSQGPCQQSRADTWSGALCPSRWQLRKALPAPGAARLHTTASWHETQGCRPPLQGPSELSCTAGVAGGLCPASATQRARSMHPALHPPGVGTKHFLPSEM